MVIVYTQHLSNRLKEREFPNDYPEKILLGAEENYRDTQQGSYIAIKTLPYAGKNRKIMIAYILNEDNVKILTIHPESDLEIQNRIGSGRWEKYEQSKTNIL